MGFLVLLKNQGHLDALKEYIDTAIKDDGFKRQCLVFFDQFSHDNPNFFAGLELLYRDNAGHFTSKSARGFSGIIDILSLVDTSGDRGTGEDSEEIIVELVGEAGDDEPKATDPPPDTSGTADELKKRVAAKKRREKAEQRKKEKEQSGEDDSPPKKRRTRKKKVAETPDTDDETPVVKKRTTTTRRKSKPKAVKTAVSIPDTDKEKDDEPEAEVKAGDLSGDQGKLPGESDKGREPERSDDTPATGGDTPPDVVEEDSQATSKPHLKVLDPPPKGEKKEPEKEVVDLYPESAAIEAMYEAADSLRNATEMMAGRDLSELAESEPVSREDLAFDHKVGIAAAEMSRVVRAVDLSWKKHDFGSVLSEFLFDIAHHLLSPVEGSVDLED